MADTRISINSEQYTNLLRTLQGLGGFGGSTDVSALATETTQAAIQALIQSIIDAGYVRVENGFIKDGVATLVVEDTITPANNNPLPVKITSTSGDINITAGNLNVQLTHAGVNYDSTRIGNGTYLLEVNSDGSINVNTASAVVDNLNHIFNGAIGLTATQIHAAGASCKSATVTASENNTGWIRVGGSGITTTTGIILYPTESWTFPVSNTNILYAIAEVDQDDVSLTYSI